MHEYCLLHLLTDCTEHSYTRQPVFFDWHLHWSLGSAPCATVAEPNVKRGLIKVDDHLLLFDQSCKSYSEIEDGTSATVQVLLVLVTNAAVLDLVLHVEVSKSSWLDADSHHSI